jgi:Ca-activated chloride channel family protein
MRVQFRFEKFNFAVAVFILLFISIIFSKTIYAQDEIIRIDTNLVTVPVTVLDREGRYVTNLKKEDFQIFEDGVEQQVALFEPIEQPFTVLLILDISGSMTNYIAELTQAANAFVRQLHPDDQVAAATFADNLYVLFKPIKVSNLRKNIKIQRRSGDRFTNLYDAVHDALKLTKKIRGRKAIVLFSDGAGDGTFASAKDNFRNAEESETLIYTIQFKYFQTVPHPDTNKKMFYKIIESNNNYMQGLAQISGGRPYQIEKIADLEKTFHSIAEELRQQYSLGYYPKQTSTDGERRQIKVRVNVPNVAVRARNSYIVDSSKKNRQK